MQKITSLPVIIGIITVLLIVGGVFFLSKPSVTPPISPDSSKESSLSAKLTDTHEYFWGIGCSHCENMEKFLETWPNKDKLKINKIEVFQNQANSLQLAKRAKSCNLPADNIAVPFLYTPKGECLSGDEAIINYFNSLNFNE